MSSFRVSHIFLSGFFCASLRFLVLCIDYRKISLLYKSFFVFKHIACISSILYLYMDSEAIEQQNTHTNTWQSHGTLTSNHIFESKTLLFVVLIDVVVVAVDVVVTNQKW